MSVLMLMAVLALLAAAAFGLARQRALASADGNPRHLHSLPVYYGWFGALAVLVPCSRRADPLADPAAPHDRDADFRRPARRIWFADATGPS
jgi:hypothetical protein